MYNSLKIPTAIYKSNTLTKKENNLGSDGRPVIIPFCLDRILPTLKVEGRLGQDID
jgi:hypothetical protein